MQSISGSELAKIFFHRHCTDRQSVVYSSARLKWSDVRIRSRVFLKILCPSLLVVMATNEPLSVPFRLAPVTGTPPPAQQLVAGIHHGETRPVRSHPAKVCSQSLGEVWEKRGPACDVHILERERGERWCHDL